jgi:hypothetical protein
MTTKLFVVLPRLHSYSVVQPNRSNRRPDQAERSIRPTTTSLRCLDDTQCGNVGLYHHMRLCSGMSMLARYLGGETTLASSP